MEHVDESMDVRRSALIVGRQLPLVVMVGLLCLAAALAVSANRTPLYQGRTLLALEPPAAGNEVASILLGTADVGTRQQALKSRPLAEAALKHQGRPSDDAYLRRLVENRISVEQVPNTGVVDVRVLDERPDVAASLSNGLAEAYLAEEESDARRRLRDAVRRLDAERAVLERQLRAAQTGVGSGDQGDAVDLVRRLTALETRRVELETSADLLRPGRIIEAAAKPRAPSSPVPIRDGALGLVGGLLLGASLGLCRHLLSRRVLYEHDTEFTGLPVLGRITLSSGATPDRSGAEYRLVRGRILAALGHDAAVVVAVLPVGVTGDLETVTSGLADALRTGGRSVLTLSTTAVGAGGEADLLKAAARRATSPVVSPDAFSSPGAQEALDSFRGRYDHVLIAGPPADGAGAPEIVALTSVLLLMVETRRTFRKALRASAEVVAGTPGPVVSGIVLCSARRGWRR